ncbi:MAG: hypothetical protein ACE5IR_08325 [bacterium]
MRRRFRQFDIFEEPEFVKDNGRLIDPRHVPDIDADRFYSPLQIAEEFFHCSRDSVYQLFVRPPRNPKKIDERFFSCVREGDHYTGTEIAHIFDCSIRLICNLIDRGEFETIAAPVRRKVPWWSLQDFIARQATHRAQKNQLDCIAVASLKKAPGWTILDYMKNNSSEF